MNRNLFFKELRRNLVSLIIWVSIITMLICLTMSVYRTFLENQSKVTGMLSLIPKGALQFKGVSNFNDLLSVLGFYAANNVIYMMVLGSIFSMVISSNILLKEEYDKTAEYLLTRPITRSEIYLTKLCVIIINIFLLNLITSLAGYICMELVKKGPFSISAFLILSLYTFLLNILFGTIGLFISTLIKRAKPITTFGIGLVLIFYFIYTLSKITLSISAIGYVSPFRYVDMNVVDPAYKLDIWHFMYFAGISFILTILSFRIYRKKDIYT
jgi:ABC-2 type transport system permease protein